MSLSKICRKCGTTFPADLDHFYKNSTGKYGLTPRCKPCVNKDNKKSHAKRMAKDPERIRALASARSRKSYHKDPTKSREYQRNFQAKKRACPDSRAKINMAKRAGGARLTQEDFDLLFVSQGCVCAICGTNEPGAKHGWNIDHCHKTRKVRFILCAHCNRGLGAFRDNPSLMRQAADVLEEYQNQADRPVEAIYEKG